MASGLFTLKQQLQGLIQKAWTGSQTTNAVEYLVVAGGGGGGTGGGGGGGAGGLLQGIVPVATGSSITVTVGSGGAIATSGVASVFGSIQATGGGFGGTSPSGNGASGGSGGGGSYTAGVGGQGTFGQGNRGGASSSAANNTGGGGGAGTVGLDANSSYAGNGGAGIASSISGTVVTYSGGAGGGGVSNGGDGGVGGGGNGSTGSHASSSAGGTNTGGGGGGAYAAGSSAGGSGIVIISYPDTYNAPSALTGTYTASTTGSGSLSFNGSTQYLSFPNTNSAVTLGSNNFTFEGWLYITAYNSLSRVIDWNPNGSSGYSALQMTISSAGAFYVSIGNSAGNGYAWSGTLVGSLPLNTWTHVAIVRNGSTATFYINGVSTYTNSVSGAAYDGGTGNVSYTGRLPGTATYYFTGYMSNLRLVNGTALYTSNFTPPTAPLTPITNTTILLNSVSGAYLADSSVNAIINTNGGGVSWNQLSPFATGLGYKKRVYTWTASGSVTF